MQRSETDGSLNPIREDIRIIKMKADKEKIKRKLSDMELAKHIDAIESFLDGQSHFSRKRLPDGSRPLAVKFTKVPLAIPFELPEPEEDGQ